ncbi:MAG: HPF/RaiA family ribosome-associated protein [Chitinophagales bacterium]
MDVIIQSLGFKASPDLEAFVREKLEKFDKELNIIRANVTLFGSQSNSNDSYCEIRLEVPGNDLFVKRNSASVEKAIADTISTLKLNVLKAKEKQFDRDHGSFK